MSCEQARKLIEKAYRLKDLDDCIEKVIPSRHRADFKQELFLILLQKDCAHIESLGDKLNFYIVRIILNLSNWQRGMYQKKYVDPKTVYDTEKIMYSRSPAEVDTMEERVEREDREDQIIKELEEVDGVLGNTNYPFYKNLIRLLAEYGSMSEVSRETGIPKTTIHRSIQRVRDHYKREGS